MSRSPFWAHAGLLAINLPWLAVAVFVALSGIPFAVAEPDWRSIAFLGVVSVWIAVLLAGYVRAERAYRRANYHRARQILAVQFVSACIVTVAYLLSIRP